MSEWVNECLCVCGCVILEAAEGLSGLSEFMVEATPRHAVPPEMGNVTGRKLGMWFDRRVRTRSCGV